MNDEIKEILDFLLYNDKLTTSGKRKLRDYITNLQQENLSLAKENEQEKQFIKDCGFENVQQLALDYIGIRQEKEDYKSRIKKAVEIINLIKPELWNISNKMTYKLIDIEDILNGRSDE